MSYAMTPYYSVARSNMPREEKSAMAKYLGGAMEVLSNAKESAENRFGESPIVHALQSLRASGEGAITGTLLGGLHAQLPGGLDVGKVPVDGALAAVVTIAGFPLAGSGLARDCQNIAGQATAIYSFRKTYDLLAERRMKSGGVPGGVFGPAQKAAINGEDDDDVGADDPIIAVARTL